MNTILKSALVAAAVTLSMPAIAAEMTKAEYTEDKERIEVNYQADRATCDPLMDHLRGVCRAEAKGRQNAALSVLEEKYRETRLKGAKNAQDARVQ